MIIKTITNCHFALIQSICGDQWQFQKCYARLDAVNMIGVPVDIDRFKRFVCHLVRFCYDSAFFLLLIICFVFYRGTSVKYVPALGLSVAFLN